MYQILYAVIFTLTTIFINPGSLDLQIQQQCQQNRLWHFVINQLDNPPEIIHVIFDDGNESLVPLSKFTGGVAHYETTEFLDSFVNEQTHATIDGNYGQFNLSCPEPTNVKIFDFAVSIDSRTQSLIAGIILGFILSLMALLLFRKDIDKHV